MLSNGRSGRSRSPVNQKSHASLRGRVAQRVGKLGESSREQVKSQAKLREGTAHLTAPLVLRRALPLRRKILHRELHLRRKVLRRELPPRQNEHHKLLLCVPSRPSVNSRQLGRSSSVPLTQASPYVARMSPGPRLCQQFLVSVLATMLQSGRRCCAQPWYVGTQTSGGASLPSFAKRIHKLSWRK